MPNTSSGAAKAAPAPTGHSVFGASGAHRWTVCHGSIAAQCGLPDDKSPYAQEGTALHAVAALCLTNGQDAIEYAGRIVEEVEIDEEHCEAVQAYLDEVRKGAGELFIETRFHLKHLHSLFFGTADAVRIEGDTVTVYDAKFGRGKIVEVMEYVPGSDGHTPNLQLAYYALGALSGIPDKSKIKRVTLVVVQPRAYHKHGPVRSGSFTVKEIMAVGPLLVAAARECEKPNASRIAGDHCTFCKAAGQCKTLRQLALDAAQLDFDDEVGMKKDYGERTANPVNMTDAELSRTLDAIDVIEDWIKACRAHAHVIAGTASGLAGWKLVAKQARRKWSDETAVVNELCFGFGLDEGSIYARKLLSPTQVEKLLPPTERKSEAFKALCPAVSSGSTLVRADSPRPELKPVQADFDDGLSTADDAEW